MPGSLAYFGFSPDIQGATGATCAWLLAGAGYKQHVMQVWPAIDLRGGRCVRLVQGDYNRETVFGDDPAAMARHWVGQGAKRLHLVDLDGARDGESANRRSIAAILAEAGVACQLGGGIRSAEAISEWLDAGCQRVILGTAAVADEERFRAMCRQFPGRLVLGIDARDGRVATDGWLKTCDLAAIALARRLADEPIAAIVYTDIATDGMLAGPNVEAMARMQEAVGVPVIASGGVSCADDVAELAAAGLAGCIIGRALYEQRLTLAGALAAAGESAQEAE
jgi:phosphoribosylformimino-5-aminoimidazole carboxamide ribotide isomerase